MANVDQIMLNRAARAALRGVGAVEPNPLVGCAIGTADGALLGLGHHHRFGGPHAEVEALARCQALGHDPTGATCWVTLEPCSHIGKNPPCADALIEARVARVVIANADPSELAGGGSEKLRGAGIDVEFSRASPLACTLARPYIKRLQTGLPWVIAKWAQTIDGKVATRTGQSQWISNECSRRWVHRYRGMSGALLSAIGTVRADDPRLTVRGVHARRMPLRVVVDPRLEIPLDSQLVRSAREVPLVIATVDRSSSRADALASAGATIIEAPDNSGEGVDLPMLLRRLSSDHEVSTVLCEAGPRLLGRLFAQGLVDESLVYIAPRLMGDHSAPSAINGNATDALSDASRWTLWRSRQLAGDLALRYIRSDHLEDS